MGFDAHTDPNRPKGWLDPLDRRSSWTCDPAFYFKLGTGKFGRCPVRYMCKTCRKVTLVDKFTSRAERHTEQCPWYAFYAREVPTCPDCRCLIYRMSDHEGWCDLVRQLWHNRRFERPLTSLETALIASDEDAPPNLPAS